MQAPTFYGFQDQTKKNKIIAFSHTEYNILAIYGGGKIGYYSNQCYLEDFSPLGKNQAATFNSAIVEKIGKYLKNS